MAKVWLEVGSDGVGVITFENPPVNALTVAVWNGLYLRYKEAYESEDVKAIVLTGGGGKFCGGADVSDFKSVFEPRRDNLVPMVRRDLTDKFLEDGPKPSVAAIETFALGGGLEVAMICHARIAVPKATLSLPELQLGIIPGLGGSEAVGSFGEGTQRLPRLVGVRKALEMMLASKPVSSEEAKELGLVDEIAPSEELLKVARNWALDIAQRKRIWQVSLLKVDRIGPIEEALHAVREARSKAQKTLRNVVHPFKCLDAIEEGLRRGGSAGTAMEATLAKELMQTLQSKALVHVFFAQRASSKIPGISDQQLKPRLIRTVAVVGGGLMGSGIATSLILSGISVYLKEVNSTCLQAGTDRIAENLRRRLSRSHTRQELLEVKLQETLNLVKGTLDYNDFRTVDLVIEAVVENVRLKQEIFYNLEKYCSPQCILASNTSTVDLRVVGARTNAQHRIVGLHYFSPAHVMPLLEIVRTEHTSAQVLVDLLTLAKITNKVSVVVKSSVGFAVNRVFFPYKMAAVFLAVAGVDPSGLDRVMEDFGMPMGPFRLSDLTGIEVTAAVTQVWCQAFPDRTYRTSFWDSLVKAKRLGEKVGRGTYDYKPGSRVPSPSIETENILQQLRRSSCVKQGTSWTAEEMVEMILFPVVNEACRILEEGVVISASDLDLASVLGMGFPKYRGGVVFWADVVGPGYICSRLAHWSSLYGEFFKPSSALERVAAQKRQVADIPTILAARL